MTKYRIVEATKASGFKLWIVQRKFLWWWEHVDSYTSKSNALFVLGELRRGVPEERRKVLNEAD